MMTLPQNCKGWQRWIPHGGGGVVSEGEFFTSTDLLLPLLFLGPVNGYYDPPLSCTGSFYKTLEQWGSQKVAIPFGGG